MGKQFQRDDELDALRQRAGIASRRSQELIARTKELLAKSKVLADAQSVDWREWKSRIETELESRRARLLRAFSGE